MAEDDQETKAMPPPMIGSYRLVEPLGSGGMSSVFRALHKDTGHEVAVKVLPRYLAKNSTLLQRFLREAKSAASLEDPNIVAIYDRGSEAGRHYLVLEYVPGGDLHDRVREHGPLPVAEAVDAIRQVALGLKHAAGRGLIHRDIKPANILRTPDGRVKVTDLGLALQVEDEDERVTRDGTTVGTVDYMAPEQARDSRATSVKSDMYSLGCTFFYLLTGAPPFQGGDVAEKLRAHATEPIPDPRDRRPEVPEIVSRLVRKMMAKKPDKRFPDYDGLLDTLDAITAWLSRPAPAAGIPPAEPLYALIDDEDDGPLQAIIDDDDIPTRPAPLMALLDDDDESPDFTLGPGPAKAGTGGTTTSSPVFEPSSLDLSSLSALVEGEAATRKRPISPSAGGSGSARMAPSAGGSGPAAPAVGAPPPDELYDLAPPVPATPHLYEDPPPSEPVDLLPWLIRGVLLAVAGLVGWFAWSQYSASRPIEQPEEFRLPPHLAGPDDGQDPRAAVAIPPWVEPEDAPDPAPADSPVPSGALAALDLAPAAEEAPPRVANPVPVRRVAGTTPSLDLRDALDKLAGTVVVEDDGPLEEGDLRVAGKSRVIRAAPGYRPAIVLGLPDLASVRSRPASIVLTDQSLVVEGIDFVIPGDRLSPRQGSFFLLRKGSELTLRDCTITVVGPVGHAFAAVQVGERGTASGAPGRVRLERTLVRGDAVPLRLAGAADATIARSALIAGRGGVVEVAGAAEEPRSLAVFRSVLAGTGPVLELSGAAGSAGAVATRVRAFESTFASIGEGPPPPFVGLSQVPAGPPRTARILDWKGDANRFLGWRALSASAPGGVLASLRDLAPGTDASSADDPARWPVAAADPWAPAVVPAPLAKGLAAPVARVPTPGPSLRERTVGRFPPIAPASAPAVPAGRDLAFDASDPELKGDLGRFLALAGPKAGERLRVVVSGEGTHLMTPIALPEGASLEVVARPDPKGRPLIWNASDAATDPALLSARRGSIRLEGVRLSASPKARLQHLVSVDQGDLTLARCILTGPDDAGPDAGLLRFRTEGTRPYPDPVPGSQGLAPEGRPACSLADCVLIGGGSVLAAEVGRGVVTLSNCAIAASSVAIRLTPEPVRRDRFAADLAMDRCTIVAARDFVALDSWTGLPPGPDRPWVVRTSGCAFLDAFERGRTPPRAVLLRTDEAGLSRGVLAWQSSGDVYDLSHFALGASATPPPSGRFDVEHDWIDLWGAAHIADPRGPKSVRLKADRLVPGSVAPGDLALDPDFHPGRPGLDAGADLGRMGVAPGP